MFIRPLSILVALALPTAAFAQVPTYIPPPPIPQGGMNVPLEMPEPIGDLNRPPPPANVPGAPVNVANGADALHQFNLLKVRVDQLEKRIRALENANEQLQTASKRALVVPERCYGSGVVTGGVMGLSNPGTANMSFPLLSCRGE